MRPLPGSLAGRIRQLVRRRQVRSAERAFVLEGDKPIRELLRTHARAFRALVVTSARMGRGGEPGPMLQADDVPIYVCPERTFRTLTDLVVSPGLLAVVDQPTWEHTGLLEQRSLLGFYAEGLQDPANVGSVIRTALAFGLAGVWLSADSADVYSPKVVRGTAGAVLKIPILGPATVESFVEAGCTVMAAGLPGQGTRPIQEITRAPARAIIALGNESRGLSEATLRLAAVRFHIPIDSRLDSLNVAASAAIAAFYFQGVSRGDHR